MAIYKKEKNILHICLLCDEDENNVFVCNEGTTKSIRQRLTSIHLMNKCKRKKKKGHGLQFSSGVRLVSAYKFLN